MGGFGSWVVRICGRPERTMPKQCAKYVACRPIFALSILCIRSQQCGKVRRSPKRLESSSSSSTWRLAKIMCSQPRTSWGPSVTSCLTGASCSTQPELAELSRGYMLSLTLFTSNLWWLRRSRFSISSQNLLRENCGTQYIV
jgi:hypothetical protein